MKTRFSKKQISSSAIILLVLIAVFLVFYYWQGPIDYLRAIVGTNPILGPLAYIALAFFSVVLAPFTIIPLIPVASAVFGPLAAAIYSVIGWGAGGIVAFIIARHVGRPVLSRFVSLDSIKKFESYIPEEAEFWYIFLLRMVIPVDGLSYALGLLSTVSLWKYSAATVAGITPMAFVFSYAGGALIYRDLTSLLAFLGGGIVLFSIVLYLFFRDNKKRKNV